MTYRYIDLRYRYISYLINRIQTSHLTTENKKGLLPPQNCFAWDGVIRYSSVTLGWIARVHAIIIIVVFITAIRINKINQTIPRSAWSNDHLSRGNRFLCLGRSTILISRLLKLPKGVSRSEYLLSTWKNAATVMENAEQERASNKAVHFLHSFRIKLLVNFFSRVTDTPTYLTDLTLPAKQS